MWVVAIICCIFANAHSKKKIGLKIILNGLENIESKGRASSGCCDRHLVKGKKCTECRIYTHISQKNNKFKVIHKTTDVVSARQNFDFSYEDVSNQDKIYLTKIFFTNEYQNHRLANIEKEVIDNLMNYNYIFFFDMMCNPCFSIRNYIRFYGYIKLFFTNTNVIYRALRIIITQIIHDRNQLISGADCPINAPKIKNLQSFDSKTTCAYNFGFSNIKVKNSYHGIKLPTLYSDQRINQFLYHITISQKDLDIFYNEAVRLAIVTISIMSNNNTSTLDLWILGGIHNNPYQKLKLHNIEGNYKNHKLTFELFYMAYGYSGKNAHYLLNPENQTLYYNDGVDLKCENPYKSGKNCGKDSSKCNNQLCHSRGVCRGSLKNYLCNCTDGYFGRKCQHFVCEKPCLNRKCIAPNTCSNICDFGWSGINCDQVSCKLAKCLNNNMCTVVNNKTKCLCDTKLFAGTHCQYKCINPCIHGECAIQNKEIRCQCSKLYQGLKCDKTIDFENESAHLKIYQIIIILFFIIIAGVAAIILTLYIQVYFLGNIITLARNKYKLHRRKNIKFPNWEYYHKNNPFIDCGTNEYVADSIINKIVNGDYSVYESEYQNSQIITDSNINLNLNSPNHYLSPTYACPYAKKGSIQFCNNQN